MPGEIVRGRLEGTINGQGQPLSSGQVNVVLWLAERPEEQFLITGQVEPDGEFRAVVPQEIMAFFGHTEIVGEALYLGTPMWAPCRSGMLRLA